MNRRTWVLTPNAGGQAIPKAVRANTQARIERHAAQHFAGRYTRIEVRFKGQFCYVDAYTEPVAPKRMPPCLGETRQEFLERLRQTPTHLCRLRFFSADRWSLAVFTYSSEKYEESVFPSGEFWGKPEDGFHVAANLYLS